VCVSLLLTLHEAQVRTYLRVIASPSSISRPADSTEANVEISSPNKGAAFGGTKRSRAAEGNVLWLHFKPKSFAGTYYGTTGHGKTLVL